MRATLARQRRHNDAAVDAPSWLPSPAEVLEALHMEEARDVLQPPAQREEPPVRSWAIHVPEEEWAKFAPWWSGAHWFDTLMDWLLTAEREKARQRWHVADETLLAIAHVLRFAAEPSTGRHVTISQATVRARVLVNTENAPGRTIRLKNDETIRLAVRTLEAGGFVHIHATGRDILSREEKAEAFEAHGGRQERAGNVMALTLPVLPAVENPDPVDPVLGLTAPPLPKHSSQVDLEKQSPKETERAPRAQQPMKRKSPENQSSSVPEKVRSLDRQQLLAHLDRHYGGSLAGPRLGKSGNVLRRHIGQLENALINAGVDLDRWTWWQIAELVDAHHSDEKISAQQRVIAAEDPLRYFIWMVKQVITPGEAPRTIIPTKPADLAHHSPAPQAPPAATRHMAVDNLETHAEENAAVEPVAPVRRARAAELQRRRARLADERALITLTLLGEGKRPADFPAVVRELHAEVQRFHELITGRGWELDQEELAYGDVVWVDLGSGIRVADTADLNARTTIRFAPPATAGDQETYVINKAGQPHTDRALRLGAVLRALD